MPRAGEFTYFSKIGPAGREHSLNKPFSDEQPGLQLMETGAVLSLLPPPPADVLECGCGTGWFTWILAKCGYRAVGMDASAEALMLAKERPLLQGCEASFVVGDFESLPFVSRFDAIVYFSALHHAVKPEDAVRQAYVALRPNGIVVASEPGVGHHHSARNVREEFDVTDEDMPPSLVGTLGRRAGFRKSKSYPHGAEIGRMLYGAPRTVALASVASQTIRSARNGISVLMK